MRLLRVTIILLLSACGAARPLCVRAVAAPAGGWPDDARGRTAAGYLAAFNSGDPAAVVAFGRAHRSPSALGPEDPDQAASVRQMAQALGCLEPRRVDAAGDALTVSVATAKEDLFALRFLFDDDARIRSVHGAPIFADESARTDDEAAATVATYTDALAQAGRFSGVVLLAHHGRPFLLRAWGLADRAAGTPNTVETRFNIGSIGKMFTAVAISQLAVAGTLDLTDPVSQFLTLPAGPAITIHQLLTHQSGLADDYDGFQAARDTLRTPSDYLARFGTEPLAFPPGTGARYSNFGFVVLARIVEVISGQPFADYLRSHVFAPAGMTATDLEPLDVPRPGRAIPYAGPPDALVDATARVPVVGNGFGCELASAEDLLRFATALVENRLLPAAETARMTSTQLDRPDRVTGPMRGYGLGVFIVDVEGQRAIGHDGGAPGVSAFLRVLPERDYTIVVLANQDAAAARIGPRALHLLAVLPRE